MQATMRVDPQEYVADVTTNSNRRAWPIGKTTITRTIDETLAGRFPR
jgi:hypothetical protein